MPRPMNERQALSRRGTIYRPRLRTIKRDLEATPRENTNRRERLEWQIRRVEKRMVEVRARLMALVLIAVTILAGCSSIPVPATHTQDELRADCDRHRGWWRPDDLRGGYCEHDSH